MFIETGMKIRLVIATVKLILLYGSETWTLPESLKKQIDGCYTRMLRMAMNADWKQQRPMRKSMAPYQNQPMKIRERRMRLAGRIHRHPELVANRLLLLSQIMERGVGEDQP